MGRGTARGGPPVSRVSPPPSLRDGRRPAAISRVFAAMDSTFIREAWSPGLASSPAEMASSKDSGLFWAGAASGRKRMSAMAKVFLSMTGLRLGGLGDGNENVFEGRRGEPR